MRFSIPLILLVLMFTSSLSASALPDSSNIQKPGKQLSFDLSHRMRIVSWDAGMQTMNGASVSFTRNRTRLGARWQPQQDIVFRVLLTNEFFTWLDSPTETEFTLDEIIFENIYLKWANNDVVPLVLTVGRFDMQLGEGFVVMDGTPLDGSRTLYMNGIRIVTEPVQDHVLTLFYVHQPTKDLFPVINDQKRMLSEYVLDAAGVYYSSGVEQLSWDAYALYSLGKGMGVLTGTTSGPKGNLSNYTLGTRLNAELLPGVSGTVEGALQQGSWDELQLPVNNKSTWAAHGNIYWDMRKGLELPTALRIGMYRYSNAGNTEGIARNKFSGSWDPIFGRWPKWNESMVFTTGILPLPGYWSMIQAPYAELNASLDPDWMLRLSTQFLSRPGDDADATAGAIGTLFTAHAFWTPDMPLSGHIMAEYMKYAADFTADASSYLWLRLEVMYRMQW